MIPLIRRKSSYPTIPSHSLKSLSAHDRKRSLCHARYLPFSRVRGSKVMRWRIWWRTCCSAMVWKCVKTYLLSVWSNQRVVLRRRWVTSRSTLWDRFDFHPVHWLGAEQWWVELERWIDTRLFFLFEEIWVLLVLLLSQLTRASCCFLWSICLAWRITCNVLGDSKFKESPVDRSK